MSNVTDCKGMTTAQVIVFMIQVAVFVLIVFLINALSPIVSRVYIRLFHGQPIIPLTEFVTNIFSDALMFIVPVMLAALIRFRNWRNWPTSGTFLNLVLLLICGFYLAGLTMPLLRYTVGIH